MTKNRYKIFILAAAGLLIFDLCAAVYIFFDFTSFIKRPFIPGAPEKTMTIPPGQGLRTIAGRLEKEGIISNSLYFSLYTKLKKAGKNSRPENISCLHPNPRKRSWISLSKER
nr:hypothetical protein [Desulfobacula sp.]